MAFRFEGLLTRLSSAMFPVATSYVSDLNPLFSYNKDNWVISIINIQSFVKGEKKPSETSIVIEGFDGKNVIKRRLQMCMDEKKKWIENKETQIPKFGVNAQNFLVPSQTVVGIIQSFDNTYEKSPLDKNGAKAIPCISLCKTDYEWARDIIKKHVPHSSVPLDEEKFQKLTNFVPHRRC